MSSFLDFISQIKDKLAALSYVIAPFGIALLFFLAYKLRKSGRTGNRPTSMFHEGYYEITRDFDRAVSGERLENGLAGGYRLSGSALRLFENRDDYFYLRKDPFDIEAIVETATASNGKKYRAIAVTTVYLPSDKIDVVISRFYNTLIVKRYCDKELDAALTQVLTELLEATITNYDGEEAPENLKSVFAGNALGMTMMYGHLIASIPTFNVVEIKE